MAKLKSGRPFEKMVALIQEAYRDLPHTKIYTNHLVKDRLGKNREFDVFIVTKVNGYDFRIAIECKDYVGPVPVEKIEAFNSKCSTVSNINKKVLISSNGFQSGAIENAAHFDIELQTLSTIKNVVLPDKEGNQTGYIGLRFEILDYTITVNNNFLGEIDIPKKAVNENSTLAISDDTPVPTLQFLNQQIEKLGIRREILESLQKEATRRGVLLFQQEITITDTYILSPFDRPINIYIAGKKSSVAKIKVLIKVTCRPRSKDSEEVEVRSHSDVLDSKKGELLTVKFDETETQFYYEQLDEDGRYLGTVAVDSGNSTKLSSKFTIDTRTGKFIDPNGT
ncbi:hypothetical protein BN8_04363 [Fibrisoma limi BUZ 3]|uniref:Restriction endonuclease type IV Mrr domain-containing protein n=1 Tax=Fibrisoma limi BUZ 3 TaxID=1185876 RepID=I2GMJ9_9BACT|nr:restriction endonuclease [Fibrisoma limi]CCH55127.1 hypothetical protein BN8_04363 [Fibrisoma limi BUZ 3]